MQRVKADSYREQSYAVRQAEDATRIFTLEKMQPSSIFRQVSHHSVAATMGESTPWFLEKEKNNR